MSIASPARLILLALRLAGLVASGLDSINVPPSAQGHLQAKNPREGYAW